MTPRDRIRTVSTESNERFSGIVIMAIFAMPLVVAGAVLLPALFAMWAINCILDIHYPGHHVGYGEAYAIVYVLGLIGGNKITTNDSKDD